LRHARTDTTKGTKAAQESAIRDLPAQTGAAQIASSPVLPPDPERMRAQEILEQVSGHLKREPTQSSRLLQSWIHSQ
jgi:flagellar M-ring protein FliF